jgi:hypothetical protein
LPSAGRLANVIRGWNPIVDFTARVLGLYKLPSAIEAAQIVAVRVGVINVHLLSIDRRRTGWLDGVIVVAINALIGRTTAQHTCGNEELDAIAAIAGVVYLAHTALCVALGSGLIWHAVHE